MEFTLALEFTFSSQQDEQSLDVHEVDSNIPAIFTGENLELDYLDLNYEEKSAVLCEKYFK